MSPRFPRCPNHPFTRRKEQAKTCTSNRCALDVPLALSGVMVGLGVLLGILKVWPALFSWYGLPILPHAMLTTPFVVRILLPAMREIDSDYEEAGKILGYNQYQRFFR